MAIGRCSSSAFVSFRVTYWWAGGNRSGWFSQSWKSSSSSRTQSPTVKPFAMFVVSVRRDEGILKHLHVRRFHDFRYQTTENPDPGIPFTTIENKLKPLFLPAFTNHSALRRNRLLPARVIPSSRKYLIAPMAYRVTKRCSPRGSALVNVKTMGGRRSRYWCGLCSGGETKPALV
jgi:hypothetical protein